MNDTFYECPNGCGILHEDVQNVGFTPPEGVPHYEVEGWYCPKCGYKTESEDGLVSADETPGQESE